jgi:hypothetical protein
MPTPRPPLLRQCLTCRYWGTLGDGGGLHRYCQEPENLRELGTRGDVRSVVGVEPVIQIVPVLLRLPKPLWSASRLL